MEPRFVTILTDSNTRDYYHASVVTHFLVRHPNVKCVTISDGLTPFNLAEAFYNFNAIFREFPTGTIHLIGVDTLQTNKRPMLFMWQGHYLLGYDNGFFSLLLNYERLPFEAILLPYKITDTNFPLKKIFAPIASEILKGRNPLEMGQIAKDVERKLLFQPTWREDMIIAHVIYIDSFGNLITNFTKNYLETNHPTINYKKINIYVNNTDYPIDYFAKSYHQGKEGSLVGFYNTQNYLEISIYGGSAKKLLNASFGTEIIIIPELVNTSDLQK
jgi:S-adenosylmethionine hydrolase